MTLRHALLALLSGREMTGYEVSAQFGHSTGHVWFAPDSQIYPTLRELGVAGLLAVEEIADGGRGTKKRYRVTEAGLRELRDWIASPTAHRRQRDPAYLKAAYLEWAEPATVRALLNAHREFHAAQLETLQRTRATLLDGTHPTLAQRLVRYPAEQHERIVAWKVLAYDGLIEEAEREMRWAERGLALVDRFDALPPLPEPEPGP